MLLTFGTLALLSTGLIVSYNTPDSHNQHIFDDSTQIVFDYNDSQHFNATDYYSGQTFVYNDAYYCDDIGYIVGYDVGFDLNYASVNDLPSESVLTSYCEVVYDNGYKLHVNLDNLVLNNNVINFNICLNYSVFSVHNGDRLEWCNYPVNVSFMSSNPSSSRDIYLPFFSGFASYINDYYIETNFTLSLVDTSYLSQIFSDGAYSNGYNSGLQAGILQAEGDYQTGYNIGYQEGETYGWGAGYEQGYDIGHEQGFQDGASADKTMLTLVGALVDTPILYLRKMFGYELFGISVFGVLTTCISIVVALAIWRLIKSFFWK